MPRSYAARQKGKGYQRRCNPQKYDYLYSDIDFPEFEADYVVAVDVATENLLGGLQSSYAGKIDLCIDHHLTNTEYAKNLLLRDYPAACEIIYMLINEMGVKIDKKIADCLYTGISTDTGCFRYASTTAQSYRIAAELIEHGADNGKINRAMFETKTKTYVALEKIALNNMKMFCNDRVAVITVTQDMYAKTGSNEQETEALAPLTRQIEGVEIGITIREKADKTCKASIRTYESVNAAALAKISAAAVMRRLLRADLIALLMRLWSRLLKNAENILNDGYYLHR